MPREITSFRIEAAIAAVKAYVSALDATGRELTAAILAGGSCTRTGCPHGSADNGYRNLRSCPSYAGACPERMPPLRLEKGSPAGTPAEEAGAAWEDILDRASTIDEMFGLAVEKGLATRLDEGIRVPDQRKN